MRQATADRVIATEEGFWRSHKEEERVYDANRNEIAVKNFMTYFSGRPSKPRKTHWTMEEYRLLVGSESSDPEQSVQVRACSVAHFF